MATAMSTATRTRSTVCIAAVHRPMAQQKPKLPTASRPTRQFAMSQASNATAAIIQRGGKAVRTASTASRMASATTLMPAKSGWRFVFSQSTAGAAESPGEMVNGMLVVISPPDHP